MGAWFAMRTRNDDLNKTRSAIILSAAGDCFVRNGFHSTSMKDICSAAGMSPGTLYHYFRSKADIIAGIVEGERAATQLILSRLTDAPDFMQALFMALDTLAGSITERDLILHAEVSAEVLRRPELRVRARAADDEARDWLAAAIAEAQARGELARVLGGHEAAVCVLALIDGMLWRATLHEASDLGERLESLKQALTRLLAEGQVPR